MESFQVLVPITVRFRDADPMGHVNNAVYLTYFEIARSVYWQRLTGGSGRYDRAPFVLARAEIDFRAAARTGDRLTLGIRASGLGSRSWEFEYRIRREGDGSLIAEGRTVQVMYDYDADRSVEIPGDLRRAILEIEGASEEELEARAGGDPKASGDEDGAGAEDAKGIEGGTAGDSSDPEGAR